MKSMIGALLFLIPALAISQPGGPPEEHQARGPRFQGRVIEKLKLTDEQKSQFQKLQSEMMKKQIAIRADIQTGRVELRDLINADTPEKTKIEAKQREISKLEGDLKINHTDFWFAVNKILTPDQQKIWKQHAREALSGEGGGPLHRFADRMGRMFHGWR